ncbi:Dehydrogenase/reductase SDR member 11 [Saguinus oedipus]|uniref:Dehydrogenase/reductase SDR member 11 n=1 Tax=Saguinus oedipus TaxID=9490 RepID=A0ABQ9VQE7_SAGOE|nr:Dehydrogenase/reductase SDR member 11 [Saguinus oedipus]
MGGLSPKEIPRLVTQSQGDSVSERRMPLLAACTPSPSPTCTQSPSQDSSAQSLASKEGHRELAAECKSAGYPGTLIPYRCDLSNEEDILSMFSAIRSQHSGVDICINNAGLGRPDSLLSGSTSGAEFSASQARVAKQMRNRAGNLPVLVPISSYCHEHQGRFIPTVNVLALSICTREAYLSMKERNVDDGHIININR